MAVVPAEGALLPVRSLSALGDPSPCAAMLVRLPYGNLCEAVCSPMCLDRPTWQPALPLRFCLSSAAPPPSPPRPADQSSMSYLCSQSPQSYLKFSQIPMDLTSAGAQGSCPGPAKFSSLKAPYLLRSHMSGWRNVFWFVNKHLISQILKFFDRISNFSLFFMA